MGRMPRYGSLWIVIPSVSAPNFVSLTPSMGILFPFLRRIKDHTLAYIAIRIKTAGYEIAKIEPYLDLHEAVKSFYSTDVKKYVIANYTALQPTRNEILKLKKENS